MLIILDSSRHSSSRTGSAWPLLCKWNWHAGVWLGRLRGCHTPWCQLPVSSEELPSAVAATATPAAGSAGSGSAIVGSASSAGRARNAFFSCRALATTVAKRLTESTTDPTMPRAPGIASLCLNVTNTSAAAPIAAATFGALEWPALRGQRPSLVKWGFGSFSGRSCLHSQQ